MDPYQRYMASKPYQVNYLNRYSFGISALGAINLWDQLNKWAEIKKNFERTNSLSSLAGALQQVQSQLPDGQGVIVHAREVEKGKWVIDRIVTPPAFDSALELELDSQKLGGGSIPLRGADSTECKPPGSERRTEGFVVKDKDGNNARIWLDDKPQPGNASGGSSGDRVMVPIPAPDRSKSDAAEQKQSPQPTVRIPTGLY